MRWRESNEEDAEAVRKYSRPLPLREEVRGRGSTEETTGESPFPISIPWTTVHLIPRARGREHGVSFGTLCHARRLPLRSGVGRASAPADAGAGCPPRMAEGDAGQGLLRKPWPLYPHRQAMPA